MISGLSSSEPGTPQELKSLMEAGSLLIAEPKLSLTVILPVAYLPSSDFVEASQIARPSACVIDTQGAVLE